MLGLVLEACLPLTYENHLSTVHLPTWPRHRLAGWLAACLNAWAACWLSQIATAAKLHTMLKEADVDYELRGIEKPSDHAPIWSVFN